MPVNNENDIACSFCGKPQMMAGQLIAGAGVYICDSCVRLCMSIISDEDRTRLKRFAPETCGNQEQAG